MIAVVVFSVSSSFFRLTQVNSVLFWERREEKKSSSKMPKREKGFGGEQGNKSGVHSLLPMCTVQCSVVQSLKGRNIDIYNR